MNFNFLVLGLFVFTLSATVRSDQGFNSQNPFLGGFCSKYTSAGDWEVSWGKEDPRFHCMLIEHKLGPMGSEIKETFSGYYDMYDMNHVDVRCQDADHSFKTDGFGDDVLERVYRRAKSLGGTHCLFMVEPQFPN
jgi:hypothetical protein